MPLRSGHDCSTLRCFQKIFEEGLALIVPKETFHEMDLAAQRLMQNIGSHNSTQHQVLKYLGKPSVEVIGPEDQGWMIEQAMGQDT